MFGRKVLTVFAALILTFAASLSALAIGGATEKDSKKSSAKTQVEAPLNLAILIQDDLVARVGNELNVTREFIRQLPAGSRVMVAYVRTGSLQVRQPFTDDLESAAKSLRTPVGSESAAPY